jgi:anti-anti-sigma factor
VTGEPLTITSERDGRLQRVIVVGEIDIATCGQLRHELDEMNGDFETLLLDLRDVSFIDSTGLRVVLEFNERYGGDDGRLSVIAGSPAVERLLDVAGLRDHLPLVTP